MNRLFHRLLYLSLLLASLSACAAPHQVMVNPEDGTSVDCSTWGSGILGTTIAVATHKDCVDRLRAKGYITAEEAQTKGIKAGGTSGALGAASGSAMGTIRITSDPPGAIIFAGKPGSTLVQIPGYYTPRNAAPAAGTKTWPPFCYRVELKGYKVSETICRPEETGDRHIHFTLAPDPDAKDTDKNL
ncbi:MAG: hypothetical protein HY910_03595 [Desulfarculus sp.]|nr:hypothetical protein [Desulfarculus sp.]